MLAEGVAERGKIRRVDVAEVETADLGAESGAGGNNRWTRGSLGG